MMRNNYPKFVVAIVVATILYTMFFVMRVNAQTNVTEDTTTNVSTTMYNDCYDTTTFKGNARIEQMFVEDVIYDKDENENSNLVMLIDTTENIWQVIDIDIYQGEEVLVLLVDNGTEGDITDDVIVHCWVGIE